LRGDGGDQAAVERRAPSGDVRVVAVKRRGERSAAVLRVRERGGERLKGGRLGGRERK